MDFNFQQDYPGRETIVQDLLAPIFGENSKTRAEDILKNNPEKVKDAQSANIISIHHIGTYQLDIDPLQVFDVSLNENARLNYSRVNIQRAVRSLLSTYTAALIFFHYENNRGDWRVSFLYKDKNLAETTSAKRYTYVLGKDKPCRTIHERFSLLQKNENSVKSLLDAFSVEVLTKQFYKELSVWYFWALKHVKFPEESAFVDEKNQEYRAKNVIRLLTRLLFIWFIKEKDLMPYELFDYSYLKQHILKNIKDDTFLNVTDSPQKSIYYRAILQNLFFATLNCPINSSSGDKRKRGFRTKKDHFGVMYLMRYEKYFKDPDAFLNLVNSKVPFLNGGLFECLDIRGEKEEAKDRVYIDGFTDNLPNNKSLIVPDYIFFGKEHIEDISAEINISTKEYQKANPKGLFEILKSYNFTIEENTPLEEEVALDPELLGRVFENLLASYNPETKTTARKQTGSFYTPREIVNYMVDESLKAYLKQKLTDECAMKDEEAERRLSLLISYSEKYFDTENRFDEEQTQTLLRAIDQCKILDPACGSGAFPMGALHKMVHILHKLDPENRYWKKLQMEKAREESSNAFMIKNKKERDQYLQDISDAFDENINNPDYARKLFLIENCIYGVDIQPIATQISKLRFFISLVVDQKVHKEKENFGIHPLPNLETRFVTANALIGIDRPGGQMTLFDTEKVQKLEQELKEIRHRIFTLKSSERKRHWRNEDKRVRNELAREFIKSGWESETAEKLASWDPYDQNVSSPFFDPEWMFDIKDGFDVVIGNPPYGAKISKEELIEIKPFSPKLFSSESAILFIERSQKLNANTGSLCFIVPKALTYSSNYMNTRNYLRNGLKIIVDCGKAFENVKLEATVFLSIKNELCGTYKSVKYMQGSFVKQATIKKIAVDSFNLFLNGIDTKEFKIGEILNSFEKFDKNIKNTRGATLQRYVSNDKNKNKFKAIGGKEISRYGVKKEFKGYIDKEVVAQNLNSIPKEKSVLCQNIIAHVLQPLDHIKIIACILEESNFALLDTINQFTIISDKLSKYELWAILNSKLINWYAYRFILGKAIRTMHFDSPISNRLPLPKKSNSKLFCRLYLISVYNNFIEIINVIDALVFNLYFPDHMKERGIDVLQFVEQDINEVMQGKDFEKLSDKQKESVVEHFHKRWTDPENEVVKRMAMFKEKSPDILKVILES